jgi:hypothetical protein
MDMWNREKWIRRRGESYIYDHKNECTIVREWATAKRYAVVCPNQFGECKNRSIYKTIEEAIIEASLEHHDRKMNCFIEEIKGHEIINK